MVFRSSRNSSLRQLSLERDWAIASFGYLRGQLEHIAWTLKQFRWNQQAEPLILLRWLRQKKTTRTRENIHTTYKPQTICKGKGKDIKCNLIKHLQDSETRTKKVCAWTQVVLEQNLHPVELESYPGSRITLLVQEETTKTVASSYPVAYWHHTNSVCLRRWGERKGRQRSSGTYKNPRSFLLLPQNSKTLPRPSSFRYLIITQEGRLFRCGWRGVVVVVVVVGGVTGQVLCWSGWRGVPVVGGVTGQVLFWCGWRGRGVLELNQYDGHVVTRYLATITKFLTDGARIHLLPLHRSVTMHPIKFYPPSKKLIPNVSLSWHRDEVEKLTGFKYKFTKSTTP